MIDELISQNDNGAPNHDSSTIATIGEREAPTGLQHGTHKNDWDDLVGLFGGLRTGGRGAHHRHQAACGATGVGTPIGLQLQPMRQTDGMAVGGNRTRAPKRDVAALFAAYLAGDSLAVIGEREGVSDERIRQLFRAAGYPALASAHTNCQRSQQRRAELQAPVVEAYRVLGSITEVATQLGISVALTTTVLAEAEVETGRIRSRSTSHLRPKVTAQFCVDVLSEAAHRGGGTISEERYQAMLRAGASTDSQS